MNNPLEDIEAIQTILKKYVPELKVDRDIGKKTFAALKVLDDIGDALKVTTAPIISSGNRVKASTFADPKDVRAFQQCKAKGNSDMFCFAKGDNGIGAWGHNTAQTTIPMVALPREVWRQAGKKGGDKVRVQYKDKVVEAILGDTMPSLANIKNGAGIDLNPATAIRLGIPMPGMVEGVSWSWI